MATNPRQRRPSRSASARRPRRGATREEIVDFEWPPFVPEAESQALADGVRRAVTDARERRLFNRVLARAIQDANHLERLYASVSAARLRRGPSSTHAGERSRVTVCSRKTRAHPDGGINVQGRTIPTTGLGPFGLIVEVKTSWPGTPRQARLCRLGCLARLRRASRVQPSWALVARRVRQCEPGRPRHTDVASAIARCGSPGRQRVRYC